MENAAAHPSRPDSPAAGDADLDQVRELLFGRERTELTELRERLENPELHARDVSRVLPEAVRLSASSGDRFARSLAPVVESALDESVRRRPAILTNAIFPIIGPAIRRAASEAINRLLQTVNQALEHSFSLRGLKWRLEAMRTGQSFAAIVLSRTLVYRVEQVFLIQRPTGLLLHQVTRPEVSAERGEVVSGLLTAIQDFAADSFRVGPHESLHTFEVGALNVWVEAGPHASVAAVIRGHAPVRVREALQQAVEQIHQEFGEQLAATTDPEAFRDEPATILSACLLGEYGQPVAGSKAPWKAWALAGLLLAAAVGWWVVLRRENQRWDGYLRRLAQEDGILVVASGKHGGRFQVTGWRDPLAVEPAGLLGEFGLTTNEVVGRWEPYQALSPALVLRRAAQLLRPPEGVELRLDEGVLRADGVAPKAWAEAARRRAETIPGVQEFEASRVFDESRAQLSAALRKVEDTMLFFEETTRLTPGQDATLARLVTDLNALREAVDRAGRPCRVAVRGHTDRTGTTEYNLRLSRQRAEEARRFLESRGIPSAWLVPIGVGTNQPLRAGLVSGEEARNRRVSFHVQFEPGGTGSAAAMIQRKICLLGGFAVDKTSLADRFMERPFSGRYLTTIGVRIDRKVLQVAGQDLTLMIWDMAGEDRFQRVEESYLRGSAGYLLVVDGTRPSTLDEALLLQGRAQAVLGAVPFSLLLNKADLEAEWEFDGRVVTELEQRGWRVTRVSAKSGLGVEPALVSLAERLRPA